MFKFTHALVKGENKSKDLPTVGLLVNGQVIVSEADQQKYLTKEEASALSFLQKQLITALDHALDAACLVIQNSLNVQYGDFASIYFSGSEHQKSIMNELVAYAIAEYDNAVKEEQDA